MTPNFVISWIYQVFFCLAFLLQLSKALLLHIHMAHAHIVFNHMTPYWWSLFLPLYLMPQLLSPLISMNLPIIFLFIELINTWKKRYVSFQPIPLTSKLHETRIFILLTAISEVPEQCLANIWFLLNKFHLSD